MQELLAQATPVQERVFSLDFSICTLVSNRQEYKEMMTSFVEAGFSLSTCEFLYVDNSNKNQFDAYAGLNIMLQRAKGRYVILCHQDVLLSFDKRDRLEQRIAELHALDAAWAVAGNAGAVGPNYIVYKVSYPDGTLKNKGKFPLEAQSIDEHFMLVKNAAGLSFSADLSGFHLYGVDLCLQAAAKGYKSYVIDFHVLHKSRGNVDNNFRRCRKNLVKKYSHYFRSRWIQTPSTSFYLSGSLVIKVNKNPISLFCIRMWNGVKKRMI